MCGLGGGARHHQKGAERLFCSGRRRGRVRPSTTWRYLLFCGDAASVMRRAPGGDGSSATFSLTSHRQWRRGDGTQGCDGHRCRRGGESAKGSDSAAFLSQSCCELTQRFGGYFGDSTLRVPILRYSSSNRVFRVERLGMRKSFTGRATTTFREGDAIDDAAGANCERDRDQFVRFGTGCFRAVPAGLACGNV